MAPKFKFFKFSLLLTVLLQYNGVVSAMDNLSAVVDEADVDRDALLALLASFNNSIFLENSWKGLTVCFLNNTSTWYGITCLNDRVVGISVENLGLTGEIQSDALASLNELLTLSFKNNSMSGYLMDFSYNQKLTKIDMSSNNFDGPIPTSLVNLNSLESLQLQENRLNGSIPEFNQKSLKEFNVSENSLSGAIPNTQVLQSFGPSSYANNTDVCGKPSPTACNSLTQRPGNSTTSTDPNSDSDSAKSGKSNQSRFGIMLVVVNVIGLVVLLVLLYVYYKKLKKLRSEPRRTKNLQDYGEDEEKGKGVIEGDHQGTGKLVFMEGVVGFELSDLLKASAESLGKGNFGNTYKAILDDGRSMVVKRLRDLKPLSGDEFVKQLAAMADLRHPNLLPLLAYYAKEEKLLVHKFVPHGNLFTRLHGGRGTKDRVPFRWSDRLSIARGVARALEYLHLNPISIVPHGNLKSSNILLDENDIDYLVLVSDYGFSSIIATPIASQRLAAYKSPEFLTTKKVTKKSDVWCYGNILLELLTGRISSDQSTSNDDQAVDLCSWVHRAVREEWTAEIFDLEMMVHRSGCNGMLRLLQVAIRCCNKSPDKRPEMSEVVREVESIKVINVDSESEEDLSMDRSLSLTDESISAAPSVVSGDHSR